MNRVSLLTEGQQFKDMAEFFKAESALVEAKKLGLSLESYLTLIGEDEFRKKLNAHEHRTKSQTHHSSEKE